MASAAPNPAEPYAHLVDADYYEQVGYPHEDWRVLRERHPVHFVERASGDSFWALTKQREIATVGRQPEIFSSEMPIVRDQELIDHGPSDLPKQLITLDPPTHAKYRALVAKRMTPRKVAKLHDEIESIAVDILRDLEEHEETGCDFVDLSLIHI